MKGKLPVTGFINLETDESQWFLLIKGIINELKITGVIEKEPGVKVRIKLNIKTIISPDMVVSYHSVSMQTNIEHVSVSTKRVWEFLSNFLDKNSWMFIGVIEGEEETPIFINFFKSINLAVYSQQLKSDKDEKFFPFQLN